MAIALVMHPGKDPELREIEGYRALADEIGGFVEAIPLGFLGVAFCHEEGKRLNLTPNGIGQEVLRLSGWAGHAHDYVAGPIVVFGPHDEDGDVTDVSVRVAITATAVSAAAAAARGAE